MNKDFPIILTMLRKEKNYSQKQVSTDLGISQALLSHYEKGIRECGLDFLIKVAEYYDVSCDYLLGRTPQRNSTYIKDVSFTDNDDENDNNNQNLLGLINKRVISNSNSVLFDILTHIDNKQLTSAVSNYLMSAEYQVFRTIYSCCEHNSENIFSISKDTYKNLCNASMLVDLTQTHEIINKVHNHNYQSFSAEIISQYIEKDSSALFTMVRASEKSIKSKFK